MVKPTPNRASPHHHTFFKSDGFRDRSLDQNIAVVEIVPLTT